MLLQQSVTYQLADGMRLVFIPTDKFKTVSLALFLHLELRADLATRAALLSAVLERGSRRYPDSLTLRRELEQLYGAELSTDIHKKGERHLISCTLEMVHSRFVGEGEELFRRGVSILGGIIGDPLLEKGSFREEYVAQEKEHLAQEIKGLINDKAQYALERCLSKMCQGERYGVYKLGRLEDLEQITPASLGQFYRELVPRCPIDLYMVGDLDPEKVLRLVEEELRIQRDGLSASLPPTEVRAEVEKVRYYEESMPVQQSKLVLGYRTGTSFDSEDYYPLLMYNGILGGFPHSKLFVNVREKASLAYYVYSRLERLKGLMVIAAGIEAGEYQKALGIIEKQVEAMARGEISPAEMENTRRSLINALRVQEDSPYPLINAHLEGSIGGRIETVDEMVRAIERVTPEEIARVARKVQLDTVYLLRGEEGGEASA